jgi:hypothetical protein
MRGRLMENDGKHLFELFFRAARFGEAWEK